MYTCFSGGMLFYTEDINAIEPLILLGLKLNGTHQLRAYANDMKLLGDDIDAINKSTGTLTDVSREVGLEVNVGGLLSECRQKS
jgi:hypothetical protein